MKIVKINAQAEFRREELLIIKKMLFEVVRDTLPEIIRKELESHDNGKKKPVILPLDCSIGRGY